jgi:hypothetical protein
MCIDPSAATIISVSLASDNECFDSRVVSRLGRLNDRLSCGHAYFRSSSADIEGRVDKAVDPVNGALIPSGLLELALLFVQSAEFVFKVALGVAKTLILDGGVIASQVGVALAEFADGGVVKDFLGQLGEVVANDLSAQDIVNGAGLAESGMV